MVHGLFTSTRPIDLLCLYGSDCLAISKMDASKIDALDQWCLHMLLGIRWYQLYGMMMYGG